MTPERLKEIEEYVVGSYGETETTSIIIKELLARVKVLTPAPTDDLLRMLRETHAQDGSDFDAPDLTGSEWDKVHVEASDDFGSVVLVEFKAESGFPPLVDEGYLTVLPGEYDTWDMVGMVHIPRPWVEKERPIPEWHSLYSLCRNPQVTKITIGPKGRPTT